MFKSLPLKIIFALSVLGLLAACAGPAKHVDYTAFKNSRPTSILILPPVNDTSDVNATNGMLSQMTMPLAEAGYYVIPVASAEETFRQNGLNSSAEIAQIDPAKLRSIFGADAVLYTKVTQYGSVYQLVDSTTIVSASGKLVDLNSGNVLWQGEGRATGKEIGMNVNVGLGIVGALVQAAVKQVAHNLTDEAHDVAGLTSTRLLSAGPPNGLLYGPHSPKYKTD
ncbi:DUF799 domain-containing protein [Paraburkholderia graminis]|uniref:DUF799 domain-containing protein n=1 Tax=Paraburkholderia graminis TaxID=60548 RepID=UPI0038B80485